MACIQEKNIFSGEKPIVNMGCCPYFAFWPQRATEVRRTTEMEINKITEIIIGRAIEVHKKLGPGLLESTYVACLAYELINAGLLVQRELALPLTYQGIDMKIGYRLDMLVENKVVVEIKAVEALTDVHTAQVLTYLKLSDAKVGLLINFNVLKLITGIKRLSARI
ncbi:MAG: GxxExxY protein [Chitinophagaceae bacterium]